MAVGLGMREGFLGNAARGDRLTLDVLAVDLLDYH
jgi:hypothetical protein